MSAPAVSCKCGEAVARVEVLVVQRCGNGHFVSSGAAPAIVAAAAPEPYNAPQQRAFYARSDAIDKARGDSANSAHDRYLELVGKASMTELTSEEMSATLTAMRAELVALEESQ